MALRRLAVPRVTVEDSQTAEPQFAVSHGAAKVMALIVVTGDRSVRCVDLNAATSNSMAIRDALWNERPDKSCTVTDMKWRDGLAYRCATLVIIPTN